VVINDGKHGRNYSNIRLNAQITHKNNFATKSHAARKTGKFASSTPRDRAPKEDGPKNSHRAGGQDAMRRTFAGSNADSGNISYTGKSLRSVKGKAASNHFFRPQVRQSQQACNIITSASSVPQMAEIPGKQSLKMLALQNLPSSESLVVRKQGSNRARFEKKNRSLCTNSQAPAGYRH